MLARFSRGTAPRCYSQAVEEHFRNPRNIGSLDDRAPDVGAAVVGKAACGDVIKLTLKVKNDKIEDVKFKAFGCAGAIASSSYASELIKGMSVENALRVRNQEISDSLALPPIKMHCSLLAQDAIKLALEDYKKKQQSARAAPAAEPSAEPTAEPTAEPNAEPTPAPPAQPSSFSSNCSSSGLSDQSKRKSKS